MVKMGKVSAGNFDTEQEIGKTPEIRELNSQLNAMIVNLLSTTDKMSNVLDLVDTKIAVYEYKKDGGRIYATSKLGELLGVPEKSLQHLLEHQYLFDEYLNMVKQTPTLYENTYLVDGDKYLKIEGLTMGGDQYGVIIDETASIHEKIRLEYERDHDILTETMNRRAFFREMDVLFSDAKRLKQAVIIALDMDNLKEVNDTYGHGFGDVAIKRSADLMKSTGAPNYILSRMGGDEFMLVIYGELFKESLEGYLEVLKSRFRDVAIDVGCGTVPLKMSAGYVFTNGIEGGYDDLLSVADEALYAAKRNGKNQFILYVAPEEGV